MTAVARIMEDQVGQQMERTAGAADEFIQDDSVIAIAEAIELIAPTQEQFDKRMCEALRARIGPERYEFWFEHKTRFVLAGNAMVVEAFNPFAAKWIGDKFRRDLVVLARELMGQEMELVVRVGEPGASTPRSTTSSYRGAPPAPPRLHVVTPAPAKPASVLNSKYLLEEFVVGPSNQLAYHAAMRVAEHPGQQFNPLFIHGNCGLGKTHLLQGICQRFAKLHPGKRWLYLTGEQFTNEFLDAIKSHRMDSFRRRIRSAELLVIDDAHFFSNKKATQEEFLHTFNQADSAGRQIVLASDCAPKQIENLSDQLSSRFVSGMVLRVDSPDLPTRLEILRRRVAKNHWNLSDAVLMHVAQAGASSVRELEGLLLQVVAGVHLIDAGHGTAPEAGSVLASIRERTVMRGPVAIDKIIAAAAEHFGLSAEQILGGCREKIIAAARAVAMYLSRQHTGMSFPEIGRAMGGKNHSTVIAACQRIEGMITQGTLLCWCTPAGPRHQAISDALHELEKRIRGK